MSRYQSPDKVLDRVRTLWLPSKEETITSWKEDLAALRRLLKKIEELDRKSSK
jgi:hypothetical protein